MATKNFILNDSLRKEYLLSRGKYLEEVWLDVRMDGEVRAKGLHFATLDVATHCPNIKRFTGSEKHSQGSLMKIASGCTHLEKLVLMGGSYSDEVLRVFAANCHSLKDINLRCHKNLSASAVIALVLSNPRLESMRVQSSPDLEMKPTRSHPSPLTDSYLLELAASCRHLRILHLHDGRFSDAGVYALAERCPQLQELYFETSNLTFSGRFRVTCFQNIRKLGLFRTTMCDAGLEMLLSCCPTLELLSVFSLDEVTPTAFEQVVAARCPNLRALSVQSRLLLTDATLRRVAAHCRDLRLLDVASSAATGAGLNIIAQSCQQLEVLNVGYLEDITDELLITLSTHCAGLRNIALDGCASVSDIGMRALLHGCPLLQQVSINGCRGVSNEVRALVSERRLERRFSVGCGMR
jgi:hypothetical protein